MTTNTEDLFDDRASGDKDLDRLRASAAHVIDVARRVVRLNLAAGDHPVDAMVAGTLILEGWEAAMNVTAAQPPALYAAAVEAALTRLHERVGAEQLWEWVRTPNDGLYRQSPLRALVGHNVRGVAALIDAMPPDAGAASE